MLRDDIADENPFAGYWMEGDSLAPPCQSDDDIIDKMIELADLSENSYIFDLGCGDGRVCTEASKRFGCKSCGVEIEENLLNAFRKRVIESNVDSLVTIIGADLCGVDVSEATVIVLYLLPEAIELIRDKLVAAIHNGTVLICHTWGPKGLTPTKRVYCGEWNNAVLLYYTIESLV